MKIVVHTRTGAAIEFEAPELLYEIDRAWVHILRVDRVTPWPGFGGSSVRVGSVARDAVLSVAVHEAV